MSRPIETLAPSAALESKRIWWILAISNAILVLFALNYGVTDFTAAWTFFVVGILLGQTSAVALLMQEIKAWARLSFWGPILASVVCWVLLRKILGWASNEVVAAHFAMSLLTQVLVISLVSSWVRRKQAATKVSLGMFMRWTTLSALFFATVTLGERAGFWQLESITFAACFFSLFFGGTLSCYALATQWAVTQPTVPRAVSAVTLLAAVQLGVTGLLFKTTNVWGEINLVNAICLYATHSLVVLIMFAGVRPRSASS